MAYFYVKNSLGTRTTGGGTTKQTGSFAALGAANVYALVDDAVTDGAGADDIICISDAHSNTYGASINLDGPTSNTGSGPTALVTLVSVSDTSCDTYSRGAAILNNSNSIVIKGGWAVYGVDFTNSVNNISFSSSKFQEFHDCTFSFPTNGDYMDITQDGLTLVLVDCDISFTGGSGNKIELQNSRLEMRGGSFTTADAQYFLGGFTSYNGGASAVIRDVDFTGFTTATRYLSSQGGHEQNEDSIDFLFENCQLPTSLTGFSLDDYSSQNQSMTVVGCVNSGEAEYQYFRQGINHILEEDTSIYRTATMAFPRSSTKISLKCTTTSTASLTRPAMFPFPTRYCELSSTASDTLRIHILSSATLTDADVYVEVDYVDGTNTFQSNYKASKANARRPFASAGSTLTTNTEAWTGRTAENRYQIDIDTSGDPGADCYPTVRVYVAKASATIYFDSEIGVVA